MAELDFSLTDSLVVADPLKAGLQELDMLMSTERTELIGNYKFGLNMEQFLWDLSPSVATIRDHVTSAIEQHTCWFKLLNYDVSVECAAGTERTIYTVKITIDPSNASSLVEEQESDDVMVKEYIYR